ncbi:DUF2283 domain-containing protein [Flaviflexus massiliensis]|uniref:DUF2283 domain-containing protein n=1 Tax=Flaviflexus massiliensis TaxID=1522309 RepID=UPI0006D5AE56|nr:DUF2283 domain-containing protein [Flaviflexus massiliensis]
MKLSIDNISDVAYIELSSETIVETRELNDWVYVDLDRFDRVRGIELLALDQPIPIHDLEQEFHIDSGVLTELKELDFPGIIVRQFQGRNTAISFQRKDLIQH